MGLFIDNDVSNVLVVFRLLHRSFTRTTGSAAAGPADESNPRFDKFPLKGPPVRNLHDDTHTFTSTPVQPC